MVISEHEMIDMMTKNGSSYVRLSLLILDVILMV